MAARDNQGGRSAGGFFAGGSGGRLVVGGDGGVGVAWGAPDGEAAIFGGPSHGLLEDTAF